MSLATWNVVKVETSGSRTSLPSGGPETNAFSKDVKEPGVRIPSGRQQSIKRQLLQLVMIYQLNPLNVKNNYKYITTAGFPRRGAEKVCSAVIILSSSATNQIKVRD